MRKHLLLIFPILVSCQWGTSPPTVTDEECQDEVKKIHECAKDPNVLDKVEKLSFANKTEALLLAKEIGEIIDCSGQVNCNISRLVQSYLHNKQWIVTQLAERLNACLVQSGLQKEIKSECRPPFVAPEGPPPVNPESELCDNSYMTQCVMEKVRSHPDECSAAQRRLVSKLMQAFKADCLMEQQMKVEMNKHGIQYPPSF